MAPEQSLLLQDYNKRNLIAGCTLLCCLIKPDDFQLKAAVTGKTQDRVLRLTEMIPSIDAAKKLAKILNTTVGYLLGENEEANLFKDPVMLRRFQDISVLPDKEKECLLTTVDHFIRSAKISLI